MKAIDLIKEHIPNPKAQKETTVRRVLPTGDWYHIHHDEEVPRGHIQLIAGKNIYDLYNSDGYDDSPKR